MPHWVVQRSCKDKREYTVTEAREAVRRARGRDGKISMYRCAFADDHVDTTKRWHLGHAPSQRSLQAIARLIRERQGYPLQRRTEGS